MKFLADVREGQHHQEKIESIQRPPQTSRQHHRKWPLNRLWRGIAHFPSKDYPLPAFPRKPRNCYTLSPANGPIQNSVERGGRGDNGFGNLTHPTDHISLRGHAVLPDDPRPRRTL